MENRKVQLAELIETPITGEWGNEITDVNNQHIVKVIRTTNFTNNGEIDYSDITLRDIEYTKCEKKKLKYGDIILEKSGVENKLLKIIIESPSNDEITKKMKELAEVL